MGFIHLTVITFRANNFICTNFTYINRPMRYVTLTPCWACFDTHHYPIDSTTPWAGFTLGNKIFSSLFGCQFRFYLFFLPFSMCFALYVESVIVNQGSFCEMGSRELLWFFGIHGTGGQVSGWEKGRQGEAMYISVIDFQWYCTKRNGFQWFSHSSFDYDYMLQLWNYIYYISTKID